MDTLAAFESHRHLLLAIAYRMMGSYAEAEDMVQETFLRFRDVPPDQVRSPKALLTTIVTRLCLNQLDLSRSKREHYIGTWLPEPVQTDESAPLNPAQHLALHESISIAFMVLLETLTPLERAIFLLREVFDYPYSEIAEIVGRDEAACRQAFSRGRKHIHDHRPRFQPQPDEHRAVLNRFLNAVQCGDLDGLVSMLAEDATLWADGGGKARGAATRPLTGAQAVARFVIASTRLLTSDAMVELQEINGEPMAVIRIGGRALVVISIEAQNGVVVAVRVIGNPDKLERL
jgi:RNA polymerase sigma-70 factor, ECF subfamily